MGPASRWLAKLLRLVSSVPKVFCFDSDTLCTPRGHKSISLSFRAKRSVANPALWVQRHAGWRNFLRLVSSVPKVFCFDSDTLCTPRGHKSISLSFRAKRSVANPALWVQRHAGWRNFCAWFLLSLKFFALIQIHYVPHASIKVSLYHSERNVV